MTRINTRNGAGYSQSTSFMILKGSDSEIETSSKKKKSPADLKSDYYKIVTEILKYIASFMNLQRTGGLKTPQDPTDPGKPKKYQNSDGLNIQDKTTDSAVSDLHFASTDQQRVVESEDFTRKQKTPFYVIIHYLITTCLALTAIFLTSRLNETFQGIKCIDKSEFEIFFPMSIFSLGISAVASILAEVVTLNKNRKKALYLYMISIISALFGLVFACLYSFLPKQECISR